MRGRTLIIRKRHFLPDEMVLTYAFLVRMQPRDLIAGLGGAA